MSVSQIQISHFVPVPFYNPYIPICRSEIKCNKYCSPCSVVLKLQGEAVIQDSSDIVAELKDNSEKLGSEVAAVSTGEFNTFCGSRCSFVCNVR